MKKGRRGLDAPQDPREGPAGHEGTPPGQEQEWPGTIATMEPRADHGEETYRGSGKLAGKVALVTGGDSGIGRAVAIAFAREGADVAIAYLSEHDDARDTIGWVEKAGRKGHAVAIDLSRPQNSRPLVDQVVERFGRIDILVNNLAFHADCKFEDLTLDQVEQTFRTNVYSILFTTQAALPHMKSGGVILNTGSVTGLQGHDELIDYAATKGAIHNFTKSLARVLAPRGIRVNCVAPGPVWTPLIPSTRSSENVEGFGEDTAWSRPAQPSEIAPSFVFLASADGRYYTGEILAVTGSEGSR